MYNLTEKQKDLLRWLVEQVRADRLPEEFYLIWTGNGGAIISTPNDLEDDRPSNIAKGALQALEAEDLIHQDIRHKTKSKTSNTGKITQRQRESGRHIALTGNAYEAVDSDFDAPDTSFVKYLSPLEDVTTLDAELKQRCLPVLGAGATEPELWDSAVRTASVILERRLREVGGIDDKDKTGQRLVNEVFTEAGTLADRFEVGSERQGYRDLYAGVVGVFRNPSAHHLVDPTPEEGGAIIVLINLLLKRLEDLRRKGQEDE
jgi:hypothetical protein